MQKLVGVGTRHIKALPFAYSEYSFYIAVYMKTVH